MSLSDNMQEKKPVPLREKDSKGRLGSVDIKINSTAWQVLGILAQKKNTTRTVLVNELIENTVNPPVDPKSLSMTAQQKLEIAIRREAAQLEASFQKRMRELDEEVRQLVLERTKSRLKMLDEMEEKARDSETYYQKLINNHKSIFTIDEFKTILMCLHPDGQRTSEKLTEAFRLINSKKTQLTKEK
jgi:CHAT domain-containing protein